MKIAIFHNALNIGGIETYIHNLCPALLDVMPDASIDLVLIKREEAMGVFAFPGRVSIVDFGCFSRNAWPISSLGGYLWRNRPDILLCTGFFRNIIAVPIVLLLRLFRLPTRVVLTEHSDMSVPQYLHRPYLIRKILNLFLYLGYCSTYRFADVVVAVSRGVGEQLERRISLAENSVKTIYNPVIDASFSERLSKAIDHPWYADHSIKVILGVGRLNQQKDFSTLLQAFAKIYAKMPNTRLLILGEGTERVQLEVLITKLGLSRVTSLYGNVSNPLPYMRQAALFVLSSRFEGLPTVLIEALAAGCPVVSTDCPSGPKEILDDGEYGALVPVANTELLAQAALSVLNESDDLNKEKRQARAMLFSAESCAAQYKSVFEELCAKK